MSTRTYAHYTYQITNKASLVVLGVVVVILGSLWVNYWASIPPPIEWALRLAWSVWSLAVVIRVFEALIRRFALRQT
jgi:hypothetical protein